MAELKKDLGKSYKFIKASATNHDGNKPENVIDGGYATRWSSEVNGAELTLELDGICAVNYLGIACFKGAERKTMIGVSVSEDGVSYKRVIEKTETPQRSDMSPIPLGGTYNAKFIKIHGYGNTESNWTSICNVIAYAPQPDGSMPVDPNGPKTACYEDLSDEVKVALTKVDKYFDRVMPWLAHMYDHETHGFHMAMSGKLDPEMQPAIEMTCWAIAFISGYSDAMKSMPEDFRQNLIKFFQDRQDPETGLFIDKQGPTNAREQARNQDSGLGALGTLKASPLYPHPRQSSSAKTTTDMPLMPDYMKSAETYIKWVSSLDWENNSWGAGDQTQASQQYIRMLSQEKQDEYTSVLFEWLKNKQFENGLWSSRINFNSVSGAFKVGLIYNLWGKILPNYDTIIDTIFYCYTIDKTSSPFFVRNPLSVMLTMTSYSDDAKKKIQDGVVKHIDAVTASFGDFLCPDGAFSASKGKSMISFGGVKGSHGLYEGDIDATLMMLIARKCIYAIFDVKTPPLSAADFWDWISGKKPLPEIYVTE